ncbi:hypothetical protein RB195_005152 [Necator americanus]|uniref:Uncharacterized protein n=1 Tax=Necator americanus TaxID=51031 RepID=A0ABR1BPW3_NECAM
MVFLLRNFIDNVIAGFILNEIRVLFISTMTEESHDSTAAKHTSSRSVGVSGGGGVFAPITRKQEEREELLRNVRTAETHGKPESSDDKKDPLSDYPRAQHKHRDRGKQDPNKRRAVVYHEDEGYAAAVADAKRGASGNADDYARGSTSDEYKRRLYALREKYHEEKVVEEGESQSLYKVTAIILTFLICLMIILLFIFGGTEEGKQVMYRKYIQSLEVLRYKYGVMTENLDCSIHMKRRYIQGDTLHDIIRQGLMCLYALAPHTVHAYSSVQMILAYAQTELGMAQYHEKSRMASKDPVTCKKNDTSRCGLSGVMALVNGFSYTSGRLRESRLNSVWYEGDVNDQYHEAIWSRSFWKNTTYGFRNRSISHRTFRIPQLLVKLVKNTPKAKELLVQWHKRFPHLDLKNLSVKDSITISNSEARRAAFLFGASSAKRVSVSDELIHYGLYTSRTRKEKVEIVFPKKSKKNVQTLSFMAAFIIKVVFRAFKKAKPREKEASIAMMSLNAQTIALQILPKTREWTGDEQDPSLLQFYTNAIKQIIRQTYDKGPVRIKRNATDRVTSIMMGQTNKLSDAVLMMELSLPHIFDPSGGSEKQLEYAPFVHENGKRSLPFTSSAGVMVIKKSGGTTKGFLVATASGSERTVEGVANAILWMLLLKSGAGTAVKTKDAYLDTTDGLTHCTPSMNKKLKSLFNFACDSLVHKEPNRTVMAWERRDAQAFTLALSQKYGGYNYAAAWFEAHGRVTGLYNDLLWLADVSMI